MGVELKGTTFVDVYLHSDKDSLYPKGEELGLTGEALRMFAHLGYEHKMTYEVDVTTGEGKLIAVDGRILGPVGEI